MSEEDFPRRRDDLAITELSTQFKDFLDRYERDWKHTQEWRKWHYDELAKQGKLLDEIAPNYRRGMWVISAIILGTLGCIVKAICAHFAWK